MYKLFIIVFACFLFSCSTQKYFIVRHAEKASDVMTGDPPLSAEGEKQAKDLEIQLHAEKIKNIYSTKYKRTIATAEPLSKQSGISIQTYDASKSEDFGKQLKEYKGNILVVGHSNTVDDLVNGLTGAKLLTDLPDSEYGYIYLVTRKGKKYKYEKLPVLKRAPR